MFKSVHRYGQFIIYNASLLCKTNFRVILVRVLLVILVSNSDFLTVTRNVSSNPLRFVQLAFGHIGFVHKTYIHIYNNNKFIEKSRTPLLNFCVG